jgi:hypothetical protein
VGHAFGYICYLGVVSFQKRMQRAMFGCLRASFYVFSKNERKKMVIKTGHQVHPCKGVGAAVIGSLFEEKYCY